MSGIVSLHSRRIRNAFLILLAATAATAAANGAGWEIGTVNGSLGGEYSSLRFDKYGNGHVSFTGGPKSSLQYGFWDHNLNKWFTTRIDYADGFCALALDSHQRPHISYAVNGKLRHAFWDGTSWQKQLVEVPAKLLAFYTSIALDLNDNPSITYYEVQGPTGEQVARLRVVTWNGKLWELMTADHTYGAGKFNSLASDSLGRPHIAYAVVIYQNSSLRYAHWDGSNWNNEILDGAGVPGTYRQAVILSLDEHDNPHMAYSDLNHRTIKYATKVAGKWKIEDVGAVGKVGYPDRNGIALDREGRPYVSYYDADSGTLKIAHREGGKWVSELVDAGFSGFTSSLQIYDGTIWVTYAAGDGRGLKFARRRIGGPDVEGAGSQATAEAAKGGALARAAQ